MKFSYLSALSMAVLIATSAAAQSTTLTGVISDSMCGAHHMMTNLSAAQCTRACVKKGSDFALVVGDKVYTLQGDKSQFNNFAGQPVTVKGDVSGTTIKVSSLEASKVKGRP